jgi:RES domain-containing protein
LKPRGWRRNRRFHSKRSRQWETPPSWALGDRLIAAGQAGIIAPSFAPGPSPAHLNAIFWRWSPDPPYQVKVIDDAGRLPKDDSSWR